jgi:hypothetical protein
LTTSRMVLDRLTRFRADWLGRPTRVDILNLWFLCLVDV